MEELQKIHHLFKLKEVERRGRVGKRYESSAEHVATCMILAEYFLPQVKQKMNQLKVFKLLTYHELVEIEAGDTFLLDEAKKKTQKERESIAAKKLEKKLPKGFAKNFKKYWKEYHDMKTKESRFCQAIDKLEPMVHSLYDKEAWVVNKFTEQKLREKKEHYFKEFPAMQKTFNELITYFKKNSYFG